MTRRLFTSESVTEGHPDKLADQISDAILDAVLAQDPAARVACETMLSGNRIFLAGEITTTANVDYEQIARDVVISVGYDHDGASFNGYTCQVDVAIGTQSPDIAQGVNSSWEERTAHETPSKFDIQGAGDQGLMFGYATNETPAYMPAAIQIAHELAARLAEVRKDGTLPYLLPDGKTQVTVVYEDGLATAVDTIVISSQHIEGVDLDTTLTPDLLAHVIAPVLERHPQLNTDELRTLINPTGRFVIGGPAGDAGLTGRKIIVDTYGGAARHGGGAFSGKDPSKVDRSAAYMLRWIARTVVAARLADRCEIQVAYAIGSAHPVAMYIDTFGTGTVSDKTLQEAIEAVFDLRPAAITSQLQLLDTAAVRYLPTAAYGHFGGPGAGFARPWEGDSKIDELIAAVTDPIIQA